MENKMTEIHRIKCGNVNCYIVSDGKTGILVDTGKRKYSEKVIELCKKYNVNLIILTHAHFDHAENAHLISGKLGIPIGMNEKDCNLIKSNMNQSLSAESFLGKIVLFASIKDFRKHPVIPFKPDILFNDGDSLSNFGINGKIISLAGHTNGSIGIDVDKKYLIVGDALMNMFYPTVSMLYHNRNEMLKSAKKISNIGERIIYFGHGKPVSNRKWVK